MKNTKALCGEFCNYYSPKCQSSPALSLPLASWQNFVVVVVFFFKKKLTNLINYSFRITIMSSFWLKVYFKGSFQLSVSILTNILAIFLQHLLKMRMIPSPAKRKQTKTTQ